MRGAMIFTAAAAVIALAFWAYRENHLTQQSMSALRGMQVEIAALEEAIAVQRAEWAYLNRPARLRALVELNEDRLGLMPMTPETLGRVDQVAYPPVPPDPLPAFSIAPIEVSGHSRMEDAP